MKSPRELGLPFDDWRPGQRLAIRTAVTSKTPVTVIQSPTGSGKSTIAAAILRLADQRGFILTSTKGLEDQYSSTFEFLFDIRGMSNYRCLAARQEFARMFTRVKRTVMCDDGPCRSGHVCSLKERGCLYFDATREAVATQTGLTNYAYWLAMRRYGRGLGALNYLICDEAHALPEELMAVNQIQIPLSLLALDARLPRTVKRWRQWAEAKADEQKPKGDLPLDAKAKKQRLVDDLQRLAGIDETWAWDVRENSVVFEPTIPKLLLPSLVDLKSTRTVFLSATITPATLALLGIPKHDVTFRSMKSRFAPWRRPVYVVKTVRVDHKMSADALAFWMMRMDKIISQRLDRKGIIHSISYSRARYILEHSKHSGIMLAPSSSFELAAAVARFRRLKAPAILLSPSVMTGFNFPYTDCEYQILPKIPFPDTRSAIARARIKATAGYREHLTTQAIEQAVGRGMRADDDQCETFITDDHARWFLPLVNGMGLLSESFLDAVHYVNSLPSVLPALAHSAHE